MTSEDFPLLAAVATNPAHSCGCWDQLQTPGFRALRSTLYRRLEE